mmetsp:Transcript_21921/g.16264  ORF Transcript_21921/g.16264 Transcript_21921/m.16264 type:complete len:172 (+) Transcript_21921:2046-2561(+)
MIEIIKLSKQFKLDALFRACESHFKDLMVQSFECSNLIALKSAAASAHQKKKKEERSTSTIARSSIQSQIKKPKRPTQSKVSNMLQGLMFLPDGRVLIMDSDLYRQTIEKSIVLDLFDGTSLLATPDTLEEQKREEEKGPRSAVAKEKKQSQANQRKGRGGGDHEMVGSTP